MSILSINQVRLNLLQIISPTIGSIVQWLVRLTLNQQTQVRSLVEPYLKLNKGGPGGVAPWSGASRVLAFDPW